MPRRTIAIDFDGTLCTNEWPRIGCPNYDVIRRALAERSQGAVLILWTCREGKLLQEAITACQNWGLTFDAVNDSTPEWKEHFGNNPRKIGATEYWDDRAVTITPDTFVRPEKDSESIVRIHNRYSM